MGTFIKDKIAFQKGVMTIVDVDMGIQDHIFPKARPQVGSIIEYDVATVEGVAPEYNSFSNSSNVVTKDGKDTVRLAPVNFNESIHKETIDANIARFGENSYVDGMGTAQEQEALDGVGKLHLRSLVGTKKVIYEALTSHKIVGGYQGATGNEDIVFAVPAENKEVFDGTVLKYWTDTTNAKPLDDMVRAIDAMKIPATIAIMNDNTYSNFLANAQVLTVDNITTGTKRNFEINENVDPNADYFRAGRVYYKGKILDVYVEKGNRLLADGNYTKYMPNGYVAYASPMAGSTEFGGISVATDNGVMNVAGEFDTSEVITVDPAQHKVVYKTAPLPVLKNGHKFFSQYVIA